MGKASASHNMTDSPEWQCWNGAVGRCHDPNDPNYADWGGRGIKVCDEWRYDSKTFLDYILAELGPKPPKTVFDRINNDGHYEPGNVRWATYKQSARNKRSNRVFEYQGRKQCAAAWVEEAWANGNLHLTTSTFIARMDRNWTMERALTEPVHRR